MDLNRLAAKIVRETTEPETRRRDKAENDAASAHDAQRESGAKGGAARAAKLSPQERSEVARRAARARWAKS